MYDHGTLSQLIEVLSTLRNLPPIRSKPLPGDVPGDFDRWFDGGAVKIVTGWSTYTFANGCTPTTDTSLVWRVEVTLADGREFVLTETGTEERPR